MRNLAGRSAVGNVAPVPASCDAEAGMPDQTTRSTRDMEQHRSALGLSPEQVNTLLTAAGQAPLCTTASRGSSGCDRARSSCRRPGWRTQTPHATQLRRLVSSTRPALAVLRIGRGYPVPGTPRRDLADLVIPDSAEIRS